MSEICLQPFVQDCRWFSKNCKENLTERILKSAGVHFLVIRFHQRYAVSVIVLQFNSHLKKLTLNETTNEIKSYLSAQQ